MNDHIVTYLEYYIKLKNPQFAVMLKGEWGCGKTHFINNLINKWAESDISDNHEEKLVIKPIYISLNGISEVRTINDKIREAINPFLYSKGMKIAKKIASGIIKTTAKINFDFNSDGESDGNISFNIDGLGFFNSFSDEIKNKRIIVFDDVERCKIDIEEMFGYINYFVEHSKCKVILISNETKILKKYENWTNAQINNYNEFKEKLIGKTFEIKIETEKIVDDFINEIYENKSFEGLTLKKEIIIDLFRASKHNNLRILKQSLFDFNLFISYIDHKLREHENFHEFSNGLLAYFLIIYLELKSGNTSISKFQNILNYVMPDKNLCKDEEEKYNIVLRNHNCPNSNSVIPIPTIVEYLNNGYISEVEINEFVNSTPFFKQDKIQDWEKLWIWWDLNDTEFLYLREKVWGQFNQEHIDNLYIALHIAGLFFNLIDNGLFNKSKITVLKKAKRIVNKLYKENKEENEASLACGIYSDNSWGKTYQNFESKEFKELIEYVNKHKERYLSVFISSFLKDIFYGLDDTNVSQLNSKLSEALPNRLGTFHNTSVFKHINGAKLGEIIKKLDPTSIKDFKFFIYYRYSSKDNMFHIISDNFIDDKPCLEALSIALTKNQKRTEQIKNMALKSLINEIGKSIEVINTQHSKDNEHQNIIEETQD